MRAYIAILFCSVMVGWSSFLCGAHYQSLKDPAKIITHEYDRGTGEIIGDKELTLKAGQEYVYLLPEGHVATIKSAISGPVEYVHNGRSE